MMNFPLKEKLKTWIGLVQTQHLDEVILGIQEENFNRLDEALNRHLFKLLLYLSHVAAKKWDESDPVLGYKVYKLTELVCNRLSTIPDTKNHHLGLYHIVRRLLEIKLYNEANIICSYFKQDDLIDVRLSENIVNLWRAATRSLLQRVLDDPSNDGLFKELISMVEMELNTIMRVFRNNTKLVVTSLRKNLEKIVPTNRRFQEFYEFVLEYLNAERLELNPTDAVDIYGNVCLIIVGILCKNFHDDKIECTKQQLTKSLKEFNKLMGGNPECLSWFKDFITLYEILYQRVENLTSTTSEHIELYIRSHSRLIKKYQDKKFMEWNEMYLILFMESLCDYWVICLKKNSKQFLENRILVNTMRLVDKANNVYVRKHVSKCTACTNSNCKSRKDYYNEIIIKAKCLHLVNKLEPDDLSQEICELGKKYLEQNISSIEQMKNLKCSGWKSLWKLCGTLIYHLAVTSQKLYESSCDFYLLLCRSIVRLEGTNIDLENSHLGLKDPLCTALHRLSTLHYNKQNYRQSMTYVALNALFGYKNDNCKAFRIWTSIKNKYIDETVKLSLNQCLKSDRISIKEILGLDVSSIEYDPVELCLREAQGYRLSKIYLVEAYKTIYKELKQFKADVSQMIRFLQYFGSHSLNFISQKDDKFLKTILMELPSKRTTTCESGYVNFYTFIDELKWTNETIKSEMCMAKLDSKENRTNNNLVPAYSLINIKEHSRLMLILKKSLTNWRSYVDSSEEEIGKGDESSALLETIITAGEYARLHRYEECEAQAWSVAYKLAFKLKDVENMIYVTARSVSLRRINMAWIKLALNDATSNSNDNAVRILNLSLADFYFECGQTAQGRKLLDSVMKDSEVNFVSNYMIHLHALDTVLNNYHAYEYDHQEYTKYIVECLYALLNVEEVVNSKQCKPIRERLYGYDVLLTTSVNLSLRVNSLLSFREISAHLVMRLKMAQCLGSVPRVAELLKCLCHLDLLRDQLDDCEVKLEGLEHILGIETLTASMKKLSLKDTQDIIETTARLVEPTRDDCLRKDASPVLKKKLYSTPKFASHAEDCQCYSCSNLLHLVFVCTHVRAQLCVLQNHVENALQHFLGAFKLAETLFRSECVEKMLKCLKSDDDSVQVFPWKDRYYSVDYVCLLLNYGSFLKRTDSRDESIDVFFTAKIVCETHQIQSHPIYMSTEEYIMNERFIKLVKQSDYAKFRVFDREDVNISDYLLNRTKDVVCTTPMINNTVEASVRTMRRNKTPTVIALNDVPVLTLSDDESKESEPRRLRSRTLRRKMFH